MPAHLKLTLFISLLSLFPIAANAATPLVEFIQKPNATQMVLPTHSSLLYYTLKNNTFVTFPLAVSASSPLVRRSNIGDTCGNQISAYSTCVMTFAFSAPEQPQTLNVTISVDYQGRAPLQDTIAYNINADIACSLLNINDYQTSFCQTQYQNVLLYSSGVINSSNQNVVLGQTVGGMFGIYENATSGEHTCFISCGRRALNGDPPTETTLFELASVTKTFTGSVLGKKIYLGEVNPLSSVNPHLPPGTWLGQSYNLNANMQPATFQQLATFSGGICFSDAPSVNITAPFDQQQSDFIQNINELNRTSPTCLGTGNNVAPEYSGALLPSHNFYSNSSFGLLAQTLMNIDGYSDLGLADYNGWICRHILAPLEMTRTNACLPADAGACPQTGSFCNTSQWSSNEYAMGYHISNHTYVQGLPFPFVPWAGAGALRSNVQDMVKYVRANLGVNTSVDSEVIALINGMVIAHTSNNYLPLANEPIELNIGSQTPIRGGQGFAWVCDPAFPAANAICGKIGGHVNFRSFVGFSPSKQYGVVILFNTGSLSNGSSLTRIAELPSTATIGVNLINSA